MLGFCTSCGDPTDWLSELLKLSQAIQISLEELRSAIKI
jgi:hypothetical protein